MTRSSKKKRVYCLFKWTVWSIQSSRLIIKHSAAVCSQLPLHLLLSLIWSFLLHPSIFSQPQVSLTGWSMLSRLYLLMMKGFMCNKPSGDASVSGALPPQSPPEESWTSGPAYHKTHRHYRHANTWLIHAAADIMKRTVSPVHCIDQPIDHMHIRVQTSVLTEETCTLISCPGPLTESFVAPPTFNPLNLFIYIHFILWYCDK